MSRSPGHTIVMVDIITAMPTDQLLPLLRLFQLVSPSLPVGAYSFSQGLEWAVEEQLVTDETSAQQWISDVLQYTLVKVDGPVLLRLSRAWRSNDRQAVNYWNAFILASRETSELQTEDQHLGLALGKVLDGLALNWEQRWDDLPVSFVTPYSLAAVEWEIADTMVISGYLWAWLENQVLGAIKLVPLGQLAGQRILLKLAKSLPGYVDTIMRMDDDQIGGSMPMFAIASSRHETQYTRLFRS